MEKATRKLIRLNLIHRDGDDYAMLAPLKKRIRYPYGKKRHEH
jgi:hypothetical protein